MVLESSRCSIKAFCDWESSNPGSLLNSFFRSPAVARISSTACLAASECNQFTLNGCLLGLVQFPECVGCQFGIVRIDFHLILLRTLEFAWGCASIACRIAFKPA